MLMGIMETTDTAERGEEMVIGAMGQDQIGLGNTESNPVSDLALAPGNDRKLIKGLKTCSHVGSWRSHVGSWRRPKRRQKWMLWIRSKRWIKKNPAWYQAGSKEKQSTCYRLKDAQRTPRVTYGAQ